jgi:hypothetical protein
MIGEAFWASPVEARRDKKMRYRHNKPSVFPRIVEIPFENLKQTVSVCPIFLPIFLKDVSEESRAKRFALPYVAHSV